MIMGNTASKNYNDNPGALKQVELDLLKPVLSLLPNPVYIKDRSHKWVEVNAAFCELMGYDRNQLIGKSDFDICPDDQAKIFWQKDDLVFTTQQENINLEETTNGKGQLCWVKSHKSYYKSDDGQEFIIGVLTDVTKEKQREQELIEAKQKAMFGTKARARFIANMGHDIRTPMHGLLGMTEVLRSTSLDDRQKEIMDTLMRSSDSLMRIIDDIMDFAKIDAGVMPINNHSFKLTELVENLGETLGMAARDKGLDLIISIDPDIPDRVIGDSERIKQILMNLIENSLKFTQEGFVSICVKGRLDTKKVHLTFKVKDTGMGVPTDKLKFIFGQFEHDSQMERVNGVSGLGLSLCKKLAQLMGGSMEANSVEGVGSEFQLSLTLPALSTQTQVESIDKILMTHQEHKILIVDDIRENYEALRGILNEVGLDANYAQTAQQAARQLAQAAVNGAPYSLVIIDYLMPITDGLLLTGSLRNNPRFSGLEIIALSSVNDAEIEECFRSHGVADYLLKPVSHPAFDAALQTVSLSKV